MSIQGIRAGKAFVEFFIDDKAINSGLAKVSKTLSAWGRKGLSVAGPITAAFGAAAATFASVGSELNDLSERTGLSVESLSELSFAAKQTGTDMGVVEKATKKLQQDGIDPLKFDEIAADLSKIPDHTQRAQAAMEIFGPKVGTALLPLLRDLPQLRQQARDLGIVMSTEDATAADALGDAFDASKAQLVALTAQIGAAIAGPLTEFLTWSQAILVPIIQFIHENPVLVEAIAATAATIAVASAAAMVFGAALAFIAANPIIVTIGAIVGGLVAVAKYFDLATSAAEAFREVTDAITYIPRKIASFFTGSSASSPSVAAPSVPRVGSPALAPAMSPAAMSAGQSMSSPLGSGDSVVQLLKSIANSNQNIYERMLMNKPGFLAAAI